MRPSYLRPKDRGNYKESAITFSTFPAMQYQRFFSLFDTFSHLRNCKCVHRRVILYHKDSNMFRPTKLSPVARDSTWLGDQILIPRVAITFFFFFPFLFEGDLLRTAVLPSLCNVVSSIKFYQRFVPHFAMAIFMCIYLHYCINKLSTQTLNC